MSNFYPLVLLFLILAVVWFFQNLFLYLTKQTRTDDYDLVAYRRKISAKGNNRFLQEGLDIYTVTQDVYATSASNRALYMIRLNLYFDFMGMNLVDINFDGIQKRHEVTVVNRAGKQFNYITYYNNIPAIDPSFFLQDNLSNLTGSYPPFSYTTVWTSSSTNIKTLMIPYTSTGAIRYTIMLIWDNSQPTKANYLLSAYCFSSNPSQQKAAEVITINVSQEDLNSAAGMDQKTEVPTASASGGLPFAYTEPAVTVSKLVDNWTNVFQPENTKKKSLHYYHVDPTDETKVVYPDLDYITPFVYFNSKNGDLIVLHDKFFMKDKKSNLFTERDKNSWPIDSTTIQLEDTYQSDSTFAGVIKTTAVKRYRRPNNSTNMFLLDVKQKTNVVYDTLIKDTHTDERVLIDDDGTYTIAPYYAATTEFSIGVAKSELDRRIIYHIVSGSISVLAVLARNTASTIEIEKVLVYENGVNKSSGIINDAITMTESEYKRYQNTEALAGSTSKVSTESTGNTGESGESNVGDGGSGSGDGGGSGEIDTTGLSALEKKAVYDMVAALLFSKDAYYTSTGYTTKNCPGCVVPKTKDESTGSASTEKEKTISGTVKKKIIDRIEGTDKKEKSGETDDEEKKKENDGEKSKSIPPYETQQQTSLMAMYQQKLRDLSTAKEEAAATEKEKQAKLEQERLDAIVKVRKQSEDYMKAKEADKSSSKSTKVTGKNNLPMPPNAPSPGNPRQPSTSMIVDSYLRRPPNPNYKPPMPVAFDFSKIGWQS